MEGTWRQPNVAFGCSSGRGGGGGGGGDGAEAGASGGGGGTGSPSLPANPASSDARLRRCWCYGCDAADAGVVSVT